MRIVVLLSGGMDSTVLLHKLHSEGYSVSAMSFDYGSKHNHRELTMAIYQAKQLSVDHRIVKLQFIQDWFVSSLLLSGDKIPEGHYTSGAMKSTVVPFRNGIMLSIAAGYAESISATAIAIASHSGDHAIYPDCRPEFNKSISDAIRLGTHAAIQLLTPFADMAKGEIVRVGRELDVEFDMTWSCYKGGESPCGVCCTCIERAEAISVINI